LSETTGSDQSPAPEPSSDEAPDVAANEVTEG
jgi:hypothetical protein